MIPIAIICKPPIAQIDTASDAQPVSVAPMKKRISV